VKTCGPCAIVTRQIYHVHDLTCPVAFWEVKTFRHVDQSVTSVTVPTSTSVFTQYNSFPHFLCILTKLKANFSILTNEKGTHYKFVSLCSAH